MTFNRLHLIRQVDLFTLRLYLSVVEEQQIGRAAIRENIAASTATKRIQDLEEISGIQLFQRTPKGVVATPAGEVLARHVRAIFASIDEMRADIGAFSDGMRGEVTVASASSIIAPFLARELGEFAADHPQVDLVVRELQNSEIVHAVTQGEADVGVFAASRDLDLSGVETQDYRTDRLVAVVRRGHPLCERGSVSYEDLCTENVIAVNAMHPTLAAAAKRLGREYKPKYNVRTAGVAINLVHAGLGVTVQPECLVGRDALENVAVLSLSEPWARRVIRIATPKGRALGAAARAMVHQLVQRQQQPAAADATGVKRNG